MKNRLSVHLCGSVRKSGNDLWRTQSGVESSGFVGIIRSEWRERNEVDTSDAPRRSERAETESGLKMHHCPNNRPERGVELLIISLYIEKCLL